MNPIRQCAVCDKIHIGDDAWDACQWRHASERIRGAALTYCPICYAEAMVRFQQAIADLKSAGKIA